MKTLKDVMPQELFNGSYHDTPAFKMIDVEVVAEYHNTKKWPGTHKNVYFWVELKNGKSVGWNENPSTGWSFPVVKSV